jgi:hypothetical protein
MQHVSHAAISTPYLAFGRVAQGAMVALVVWALVLASSANQAKAQDGCGNGGSCLNGGSCTVGNVCLASCKVAELV